MPVYYVPIMGGNYAAFNPQFYLEAASHNYIEFVTPLIEYRFLFDVIGYRYKPFDGQFLQNLNFKSFKEHCYSVSWMTDAFNSFLDLSVNVNECDWGVGGFFLEPVPKPSNCRWYRYNLSSPLLTYDEILK